MRSLRELLREAGLPSDVRFHDLRHTALTHEAAAGNPMSYMLNGRQYLVVAISGPDFPAELIAYTAPR